MPSPYLRHSGGGGEEGLMHGIKIPQQDFALKMPGGAYARGGGGGGVFVGHYSINMKFAAILKSVPKN